MKTARIKKRVRSNSYAAEFPMDSLFLLSLIFCFTIESYIDFMSEIASPKTKKKKVEYVCLGKDKVSLALSESLGSKAQTQTNMGIVLLLCKHNKQKENVKGWLASCLGDDVYQSILSYFFLVQNCLKCSCMLAEPKTTT